MRCPRTNQGFPSVRTRSAPTCSSPAVLAKRDERRRHAIGHLSGQLECVPLGTTNDAAGAEQRRNDVDDLHRASASAGSRKRRANFGTRDSQGCRRAASIGPSGGDLSRGQHHRDV